MTVEMCLSTCRDKGFDFSGLSWQIECYCGNKPVQGFEWTWANKCNERCAGNSNQICGGSYALSVYTSKGFIIAHGHLTLLNHAIVYDF